MRPGRLIGVCGILFGLIDLAIFNYPIFGVAVMLMVLVGLPGVGFSTGVTTLLQTGTANQYLGRVFGALGTTSSLLALIGAGLASVLGDGWASCRCSTCKVAGMSSPGAWRWSCWRM